VYVVKGDADTLAKAEDSVCCATAAETAAADRPGDQNAQEPNAQEYKATAGTTCC
jgi:hypothetical protein